MRPVIHIHACAEAMQLERAAYYGGRCDVFYVGERDGPIYVCDVNSFYPSVMADNYFPARLLAVEQVPKITDLERWCRDECVCASAHVVAFSACYPYRGKHGSCLCAGDMNTSLCTPECARAISAGHIRAVHAVSRYERDDLFSRWVTELYSARRRAAEMGRDNEAVVYKLLLDSLYGKWGQHGETWAINESIRPLRQWGAWSAWDPDTRRCNIYRAIGGVVEQKICEGEWLHSAPAIAAHVTSYGREKLRDLITTAGVENVYYCDTDSLHTNAAGWQRLVGTGCTDSVDIGRLRLVETESHATYRGRKYYRLGDQWTVAGASGFDDKRGDAHFAIDKQERASSIICLGPVGTVQHATVPLDYSRSRMRGVVLSDGRVLPEAVGDETLQSQISYWAV